MVEGIRVPLPPGAELVQPYPVHLPQFDGPMDLLLHLVRKNEVDLKNIPVLEICRQYHEYLLLMRELDLEVAAEFLYVEALLVHIKSQMVLPRAEKDAVSVEDPRDELVRRLLEYRKVKAVAETFHEMEVPRLGIWPRPSIRLTAPDAEPEETDLSEVSLFDLLTCFRGALERYRSTHPPALEIEHARFSIKEKMEEMLLRVPPGASPAPLSEVFRSLSGRAEAIAVFLAVLELLRLLVVRALQTEEFGEIYLERIAPDDFSLAGYEEAYR